MNRSRSRWESRVASAARSSSKELIEHPGQHYEILSNHFGETIARSAKWMAETLAE